MTYPAITYRDGRDGDPHTYTADGGVHRREACPHCVEHPDHGFMECPCQPLTRRIAPISQSIAQRAAK